VTTTTTDSGTAAIQLGALRTELRILESRIATIEQELLECEFAAYLGDADAVKRRDELASQRDAGNARIADVVRIIESGSVHVKRLADAEREAARKEWQARADELRAEQAKAARRVDKALAALEAAHRDYLTAADQRGAAVRRAGGSWSNTAVFSHLVRALFAQCPGIAQHLRLDRAQRINASPMEGMVQ